jgi:membrane protein implicated in regulation of membrane protease activity
MAVIVAVALAIFVLPSPWGIVAVFAGIAIEVAEQVFWFRYQGRQKVRTGVEAHVGELAEVIRALDPEGQVKFRGEVWKARSAEPIPAGESVRIASVDRLTLVVERD